MEQNIILAGVGGQGILSIAYVICNAALKEGFNFKQAEVHGMAQRGGAVQSHVRISSTKIASDLIPEGKCDVLISVEPLESLRYFQYLHENSTIITSTKAFVNIPNYPDEAVIWKEMEKVKNILPMNAEGLAKKAGSPLGQGMTILGAASTVLSLKVETLEDWILELWKAKGEKVQNTNIQAFRLGRQMGQFLQAAHQAGANLDALIALGKNLQPESADPIRAKEWVKFLRETPSAQWPTAIPARG